MQLAEEQAKREAEEAKKAEEVRKQAYRKAMQLAEERAKRAIEETKKAEEAKKQAEMEAEQLAKEKTKKAEEVRKQAEKEGEEIYEGNVYLELPSSVGFEQFKKYLEGVENLKILWTGGSTEGTIIGISAQKPITLIRILNEMPMVERINKKDRKIKNISLNRSENPIDAIPLQNPSSEIPELPQSSSVRSNNKATITPMTIITP